MLHHGSLLQAIGTPGVVELLIILVIVLLIFGAGKLPQIGDALGKSIKNFKKSSTVADGAVDVTPKKLGREATTAETVEVEPAEEPVREPVQE